MEDLEAKLELMNQLDWLVLAMIVNYRNFRKV
jgi:hypothetical protein